MPLFWEKLIADVSRAMESKCNTTRALCGLDMCTGQEDCALEPCLLHCHLKPLKDRTLNEANIKYKLVATEVSE